MRLKVDIYRIYGNFFCARVQITLYNYHDATRALGNKVKGFEFLKNGLLSN